MAQVEFTGATAEVTFGTVTFEGLLNGTINQDGKGPAEQIDVTVNSDTKYTFLSDPMGPKGSPKARVVITLQDSTQSVDDSKQTTVALNTSATLVVDMAKGTTNANTYTHTDIELVERVTTIPLGALATCVLTFEANELGAFTGPA